MDRRIFYIRITGRVQGVGFRAFVKSRADELGVSGWVRNLPDGSVLVFSSCLDKDASLWMAALKKGPLHSRVDEIELREPPKDDLADSPEFKILRSDD